MDNIYLICKIIDNDSKLLYNFLCVNKDFSKNILNNITILSLLNNTKIQDKHLKLIGRYCVGTCGGQNLKILNLNSNKNITNTG